MDQKPDQIIGHIEAQRDQLGRNLNELEDRVRQTTDWRTHYERNPMLVLGAALGGGLLLGAVVGGRTSSSSSSSSSSSRSGKSWDWKKDTAASSFAGVNGPSYDQADRSASTYYSGTTGEATSAASSASTPPSSAYSSSYGTQGSGSGNYGSYNAGSNPTEKQGISGQNILKSALGDHMHEVSSALDHIKGAMIAFGIAKVKDFLSQAVPGLEQHLGAMAQGGNRTEDDRHQSERFSGQYSGSGSARQNTGQTNTGTNEPGSNDYRASSQNYPSERTSYGAGTPGQTSNPNRGSASDYWSGSSGQTEASGKTPTTQTP